MFVFFMKLVLWLNFNKILLSFNHTGSDRMDPVPLSYPDKNWLPWADQRINDTTMIPANNMEDVHIDKREERFGDSLQQLNKIVERISPDSSAGNYRMANFQNSAKILDSKCKFRGSYSSSFTDNLSDSAYETFAGDNSYDCPPENHYLNTSDHLEQPNNYLDVPNNQNWQMDSWQNVKNSIQKSASTQNLYAKSTSGSMGNMEGGEMTNMNLNSGEFKENSDLQHCYSYDDMHDRYYSPYPTDNKKNKFNDNHSSKKSDGDSAKGDMCGSKSFLEIGKCFKASSIEALSNDEGDKKTDDEGKMSSYNTYEEDDSKNDGDSNGKTGFMCSHCSFETFKKGQLRKHM